MRHGLPAYAAEIVVRSGFLSVEEVERLVITRSTLADHQRTGRRLTADESDRLARMVRVCLIADEHFGSRGKSAHWLRSPNRALQGSIPLELLDTTEGARLVEASILRLAYGIFA